MSNLTKTFAGNANSYFGEVKRAQERKAVHIPTTAYNTLDKLSLSPGKVIPRPQGGYRRSAYITEKAIKQEITDEVLAKPSQTHKEKIQNILDEFVKHNSSLTGDGLQIERIHGLRISRIKEVVELTEEESYKYLCSSDSGFLTVNKSCLEENQNLFIKKLIPELEDSKQVQLGIFYEHCFHTYEFYLIPIKETKKYLCLSEKGEAYISDEPVGEAEDSIDNILRCAKSEIANSFISPWVPCFINIDDVDTVQKELDKLYRKPITRTEYKYLNFHEDASLSVSDEPKFLECANKQTKFTDWRCKAIKYGDYENWMQYSTLITDPEEIQQMIESGEIETP